MADIAHQHERQAGQSQRAAIRGGIVAIGGQSAGHCFAAFFHRHRQIAAHQAKQIAIGFDLIFAVHRGHGILAIHNRGDRAFEENIGDMSGIIGADIMRRINPNFGVQIIVFQQYGLRCICCAAIADKFFRLGQRRYGVAGFGNQCRLNHPIGRNICMFGTIERCNFVEQRFGAGNHFAAAHRIISAGGR